jgi:hypothetical protein
MRNFIVFIIFCNAVSLRAQNISGLSLLGQKLPGNEPVLFAPYIVSDELSNRDIAISPKGDEIFYCITSPGFIFSVIVQIKKVDGVWSAPEVASFSRDSRYKFIEPAFSHDGNTLYFSSNMPSVAGGEPVDNDIWAVRREGDGWGTPYNLGSPINSEGGEYFPSLTSVGTIYFTRNEPDESTSFIYRSTFNDSTGRFSEPLKLPAEINCGEDRYNAFVAPDESFVVIPAEGVEENVYGSNYYIVFRGNDGGWTAPVNMGHHFNTNPGRGWSFSMSPDGKLIFFMASRAPLKIERPKSLSLKFLKKVFSGPENGNSDIYWMDASIIDELRNEKFK